MQPAVIFHASDRIATWRHPLSALRERLSALREQTGVLQFGGAVGDLQVLGDNAETVARSHHRRRAVGPASGPTPAAAGDRHVILERRTRAHVLSRDPGGGAGTRAGRTAARGRRADRLEREGIRHDGTLISFDDDMFRVDFTRHGPRRHGLRPDGGDPRPLRRAGGIGRADRSRPRTWRSTTRRADAPYVTFTGRGRSGGSTAISWRAATAFTASAAQTIPTGHAASSKRSIPSAGSASCPKRRRSCDEMIYASSGTRLRAVFDAQREPQPLLHPVQPDDTRRGLERRAFWDELKRRIPRQAAARHRPVDREIHRAAAVLRGGADALGPAVPVRRMRAHIVPPTGAKGLNLAASDVHYLFDTSDCLTEAGFQTFVQLAFSRLWQ
jgi:p-hydroxybenzoate 3-monooxygenase